MILASTMTRCAFLHSIATSAISSIMVVDSPIEDTNDIDVGRHLYTNVMNAPQSSHTLSVDDLAAQMKLSSSLVRRETSDFLSGDPAMAGSLLRLAFHDAGTREKYESDLFTGGPNGSIKYEVSWSENRGIARPLKVVEDIHKDIGKNMDLSLADCIALAGAQSVEFAGGPKISIKLGRKDVSEADTRKRRRVLRGDTDRSLVDTTLPSPGLDSDGLRLYFGALGLSEMEFVALCGAHDLGRHVTLLDMPKSCLKDLTRDCLENAPVLMPFVIEEPDRFSNAYFQKLLKWYERKVMIGEVAFIPTDVDLVIDEGLRKYVKQFAKSKKSFYSTFTVAYQKLVDAGAVSDKIY